MATRKADDLFVLKNVLKYSKSKPPMEKENYLNIHIATKLFQLVKRIFDLNIFGFKGVSSYILRRRKRPLFLKKWYPGSKAEAAKKQRSKYWNILEDTFHKLSSVSDSDIKTILKKQALFLDRKWMGRPITVPPNSNVTIPA